MQHRDMLAAAMILLAIPGCGKSSDALVEEAPGLLARAAIADAAARATALDRVPGGSVVKAVLEEEDGVLLYSYDIKVAGKDGIEEVHVDAGSGAVLSVSHESGDDESEEDEAAEEESSQREAGATLVEETPGLLARATITDPAARATALARVPGGRVVKAELEEEDGALIYSYDIAVPGREGIEEVHIDAITGAVLSVEHEAGGDATDEEQAKPAP